jgi:hypothetical protein
MSESIGSGLRDISGGHKTDTDGNGKHSLLRRGAWQTASTVVIVAGILMLVQPFALALYTYSFSVILAGSVAFVITSHFPE